MRFVGRWRLNGTEDKVARSPTTIYEPPVLSPWQRREARGIQTTGGFRGVGHCARSHQLDLDALAKAGLAVHAAGPQGLGAAHAVHGAVRLAVVVDQGFSPAARRRGDPLAATATRVRPDAPSPYGESLVRATASYSESNGTKLRDRAEGGLAGQPRVRRDVGHRGGREERGALEPGDRYRAAAASLRSNASSRIAGARSEETSGPCRPQVPAGR